MKNVSSLNQVHKLGKFGDHEGKPEENLLKISEISNICIFQIVKFKNSNFDISNIKIDGLDLPQSLKSNFNDMTRILWVGPDNWYVFSNKLDLFQTAIKKFDDQNFVITNLSHSRAIIEIEGNLADEVLKKGCPLNINNLKAGDCANSVYNGMSVMIDFISNKPKKIRISGLRSFGESLHHSITDASLEYGYLAI
jgi:heterotetrameric sarcosine oxidase gamma subunit